MAMDKSLEKDYTAIISAPFGSVGIQIEDDFLIGLHLLPEPVAEKHPKQAFAQDVVNQIKQYLANPKAALNIHYAVRGTPYQRRVWKAIAAIPSGETLTYGELADKVGSGARAVANVCGANQVPLLIPCHRIVAKGGLGGFMQGKADGLLVKQWLLDHEKTA
jgi:methylated-DNA-[protein]-cysteine S-methyltransferase